MCRFTTSPILNPEPYISIKIVRNLKLSTHLKKVLNSSLVSTLYTFFFNFLIGICFLFINLSNVTSYINLITLL